MLISYNFYIRTVHTYVLYIQWNTVNPTSQGTDEKMSDHPCCRINRGKIRNFVKNFGLTMATLSDSTADLTFFSWSLEMSD